MKRSPIKMQHFGVPSSFFCLLYMCTWLCVQTISRKRMDKTSSPLSQAAEMTRVTRFSSMVHIMMELQQRMVLTTTAQGWRYCWRSQRQWENLLKKEVLSMNFNRFSVFSVFTAMRVYRNELLLKLYNNLQWFCIKFLQGYSRGIFP